MTDVRKEAERMADRSSRDGAALAYATLDLADATRELGEKIATSLSDIEAGVTQLAVAVAQLEIPDRM